MDYVSGLSSELNGTYRTWMSPLAGGEDKSQPLCNEEVMENLPPIDLITLFRYAVPKAVTTEGIFYIGIEFYNWGTVANVWHDNSHQLPLYSHQDKDPAIALFRAIQKVFKEADNAD